jgi:manganese transport protein
MGEFANSRLTNCVAIAGTVVVISLKGLLILQMFGLPIPGL